MTIDVVPDPQSALHFKSCVDLTMIAVNRAVEVKDSDLRCTALEPPVEPVGDAAAHDPFLVHRRKETELFGEQGYCLSIGAG
jgi:hypothetical protein